MFTNFGHLPIYAMEQVLTTDGSELLAASGRKKVRCHRHELRLPTEPSIISVPSRHAGAVVPILSGFVISHALCALCAALLPFHFSQVSRHCAWATAAVCEIVGDA
jgi:hypothetical protein